MCAKAPPWLWRGNRQSSVRFPVRVVAAPYGFALPVVFSGAG